jgi:hypothetical protein
MLKRSQNFCPVSRVFQKAAIVKQMVIVLVKMEGMFHDINGKLIFLLVATNFYGSIIFPTYVPL